MTLKDVDGMEITLEYDDDGWPIISICTGGHYMADDLRPTVEVSLNGVIIHDMFAEGKNRWSNPCNECGNCIPNFTGGTLDNKHHKEACSLYSQNP